MKAQNEKEGRSNGFVRSKRPTTLLPLEVIVMSCLILRWPKLSGLPDSAPYMDPGQMPLAAAFRLLLTGMAMASSAAGLEGTCGTPSQDCDRSEITVSVGGNDFKTKAVGKKKQRDRESVCDSC